MQHYFHNVTGWPVGGLWFRDHYDVAEAHAPALPYQNAAELISGASGSGTASRPGGGGRGRAVRSSAGPGGSPSLPSIMYQGAADPYRRSAGLTGHLFVRPGPETHNLFPFF